MVWNPTATGNILLSLLGMHIEARARPLVTWYKAVWYKHSVPTRSIILCLGILGRLSAMDRLQIWGMLLDDQCLV